MFGTIGMGNIPKKQNIITCEEILDKFQNDLKDEMSSYMNYAAIKSKTPSKFGFFGKNAQLFRRPPTSYRSCRGPQCDFMDFARFPTFCKLKAPVSFISSKQSDCKTNHRYHWGASLFSIRFSPFVTSRERVRKSGDPW